MIYASLRKTDLRSFPVIVKDSGVFGSTTNGESASSGMKERHRVLRYVIIIEVMDMAQLANIHPGEVLKEEFLVPMGISQYRLAKEIGVTESRISAICQGKRAVGADTAARLARFFGTTAAFWLGLQADYDTEEVERNLSAELEKIHPWKMAA